MRVETRVSTSIDHRGNAVNEHTHCRKYRHISHPPQQSVQHYDWSLSHWRTRGDKLNKLVEKPLRKTFRTS